MTRRVLIAAGAAALATAGAAVTVALLRSDGDRGGPVTVADVREGPARLVVDGRETLRLWVVTTPEARAAGVNGHRLSRGEGMRARGANAAIVTVSPCPVRLRLTEGAPHSIA